MSRRERNRRRRHRSGSNPRRFGLGIGVLLLAAVLVAAGGVGWVLSVAGSTPDLDELKPVDKGENSVVYAANGKRLGFIQSDELRQPVPAREIPKALQPGDRRDRGRALLRARRRRLRGRRARRARRTSRRAARRRAARRSRCSSSATSTSPTSATIERKIKEAKLAAGAREGALQEVDPRPVPEHRAVRDRQRPDGDRRPGRGAGLLQQARPAARRWPRPRLLAGLPQAPSHFNPFTNADGARKRRNEVLKKMAEQRLISPGRRREGDRQAARRRAERLLHGPCARPTSSTTSSSELIEKYGVNTVRRGGLRGPHDDRPRAAGLGRATRSPTSSTTPTTRRRRSSRSTRRTATSARWRRRATTPTTSSTSPRRATASPGSTFKIMVLMAALRARDRPALDHVHLAAAQPATTRVRPVAGQRPTRGPTAAR